MVYVKYFLVFVLLFSNRLNLDNFFINSKSRQFYQVEMVDFIIIIEDDVMRVKSNSSVILINDMKLFDVNGNSVLSQECFMSVVCEMDLSSLPSGDYKLIITTSDGEEETKRVQRI